MEYSKINSQKCKNFLVKLKCLPEVPYSAIIGQGKILGSSLSQRIGGKTFAECHST